MASIASFVAGLLFSAGLVIGGMTEPSKVIGFLDFFGSWDPSLVCVMGCAVTVHLATFRMIRRRRSPLFAEAFHIPTRRDITPQLLVGSGLFGIGWGLGGFCPGPAIASLPSVSAESITFVASMSAGLFFFERFKRPLSGRPPPRAEA